MKCSNCKKELVIAESVRIPILKTVEYYGDNFDSVPAKDFVLAPDWEYFCKPCFWKKSDNERRKIEF